ncbi:MAG: hypothetical protein RL108_1737 [Bacteroidota bacterium]|jgi:hypothetical protein
MVFIFYYTKKPILKRMGFLISKINLDYASKGIIETNDLSPAFF